VLSAIQKNKRVLPSALAAVDYGLHAAARTRRFFRCQAALCLEPYLRKGFGKSEKCIAGRYHHEELLPNKTNCSQVLAPGIHYVHGLRNSPICFTAGFQISPQLRSYEKMEAQPFTMGRIQAGIIYEMPMLNLRRKLPY
jgi:hypothetical protein